MLGCSVLATLFVVFGVVIYMLWRKKQKWHEMDGYDSEVEDEKEDVEADEKNTKKGQHDKDDEDDEDDEEEDDDEEEEEDRNPRGNAGVIVHKTAAEGDKASAVSQEATVVMTGFKNPFKRKPAAEKKPAPAPVPAPTLAEEPDEEQAAGRGAGAAAAAVTATAALAGDKMKAIWTGIKSTKKRSTKEEDRAAAVEAKEPDGDRVSMLDGRQDELVVGPDGLIPKQILARDPESIKRRQEEAQLAMNGRLFERTSSAAMVLGEMGGSSRNSRASPSSVLASVPSTRSSAASGGSLAAGALSPVSPSSGLPQQMPSRRSTLKEQASLRLAGSSGHLPPMAASLDHSASAGRLSSQLPSLGSGAGLPPLETSHSAEAPLGAVQEPITLRLSKRRSATADEVAPWLSGGRPSAPLDTLLETSAGGAAPGEGGAVQGNSGGGAFENSLFVPRQLPVKGKLAPLGSSGMGGVVGPAGKLAPIGSATPEAVRAQAAIVLNGGVVNDGNSGGAIIW